MWALLVAHCYSSSDRSWDCRVTWQALEADGVGFVRNFSHSYQISNPAKDFNFALTHDKKGIQRSWIPQANLTGI
ncbi:hypothetical protein [Synechococcus sp. PCC 7336]|uniref:hypothetical protein n=1 Tax=Synechococcus sp. PCC 7336 TaxID=195250 RepID=UPI000345E801|nr:hypothetical protein [Synechococcus sp. PCC 7336]